MQSNGSQSKVSRSLNSNMIHQQVGEQSCWQTQKEMYAAKTTLANGTILPKVYLLKSGCIVTLNTPALNCMSADVERSCSINAIVMFARGTELSKEQLMQWEDHGINAALFGYCNGLRTMTGLYYPCSVLLALQHYMLWLHQHIYVYNTSSGATMTMTKIMLLTLESERRWWWWWRDHTQYNVGRCWWWWCHHN